MRVIDWIRPNAGLRQCLLSAYACLITILHALHTKSVSAMLDLPRPVRVLAAHVMLSWVQLPMVMLLPERIVACMTNLFNGCASAWTEAMAQS